MPNILKKLALTLFGDYSIYFIYCLGGGADSRAETASDATLALRELDPCDAATRSDPLVQSQFQYLGPQAFAFCAVKDARVAGLCVYWVGERYRQRNFWPLAEGEAKLVQIVTLPEMRGQGVATKLIRHSAQAMGSYGFKTVYARVWHSNRPSWRAFARAGWKRIALAVEVHPLRRRRPVRVYLGRQPRG